MDIDWITVSAQIVNFLILVGLLKHFLYQPVLSAMDRREAGIAQRIEEAQAREHEAEESATRFKSQSNELEERRGEMLSQATREAEEQKQRLLEQSRTEVTAIRRQWQQQILKERDEFLVQLRLQAAQLIHGAMRKVLQDLASTQLEEQILRVFIQRVHALDQQTKQALLTGSESIDVASAFELPNDLRNLVTRTIQEALESDIRVEYTRSSELLCGIAVTGGGSQISWSLESYLDEISKKLNTSFSHLEAKAEGN